MPTLNTEALISTFVNPIYEAAMAVLREQNIMTKLVRNFNDRTGAALRYSSEYSSAAFGTIGETDDLTSSAFTPGTLAVLTPGEIGKQYFLTDWRMESDPFAVRADAAQDLGAGAATKIDKDLIGGFSSFTGGTVGTAGSEITWGHIFAGEAQLKNQLAPFPYMLVLQPNQWQPLAKAASVSGTATNAADSLKEAVQSMFWVRNVGPISVFTTANLATASTCHAGLFSRDGLAFDLRRAPRLEAERDASRRGVELNLTAAYGYGVWRPDFGIDMVFAGTIVTS